MKASHMMIACSKCGESKEPRCFYRNKKTKSGHMSHCKTCVNRSQRRWEKRNPLRANMHRRANKYGLKVGDLEQLLAVPACQACGKTFSDEYEMKIDHCHSSGHIRGVLCHLCNLACAGVAVEAFARLDGCRQYLKREMERFGEQERARDPAGVGV